MTVTTQTRLRAPIEPAEPAPLLSRLGHFCHDHRWRIIVSWLVLLIVASVAFAPTFSDRALAEKRGVGGSDSAAAEAVLDERFTTVPDEYDLLVFHSETLTIDDPAFIDAVQSATVVVAAMDGVRGIQSPLDDPTRTVSDDGRAALALVAVSGNTDDRERLAASVTDRLDELDLQDPMVAFTGESPVNQAVAAQSEKDLANAERIGIPLALVVLVLAFGSLRAAVMPIVLALVGIGLTFGILGAISYGHPFVSLTENITTLIGLGIGIDFAMFIVARYRESISRGQGSRDAVATALSTSGRSVFLSAVTVVISMTGLFLIDNGIFVDLAIGAIVTTAVMASAALTLLPAAIAVAGPSLARGFRTERTSEAQGGTRGWARWANAVMRRPVRFMIIGLAAVAFLASPSLGLRLGLDNGTDAVSSSPAGRGLHVLAEQFSEGDLSPTQVVLSTPGSPFSQAQLRSVEDLTDKINRLPGVRSVTSITTTAADMGVDISTEGLNGLAAALPPEQLQTLLNLNSGANATTLSVVLDSAPDSTQARRVVDGIRHDLATEAAANNLALTVTGPTAHINDLAGEIERKLPWVLGYVLAMSFLLLTLSFRAPLLALKALFMNVLSVAAAYGALVWVFQRGNGEALLDFSSTGSIQAYLPVLAFAILFGISMDYEVYLLGRMREEWLRRGDNTAAVASGLAHTARPITSAAAIQCVIFGAFVFTRVIDVKQVGFALATAIAIDATLIRMVIVPASMRLMGHWNWWTPRWLQQTPNPSSGHPGR